MAGVHIESLKEDGRYRVRWRERKGKGERGRAKWACRSRTVSSHDTAVELRALILRALETQGQYVDPVAGAAAKPSADAGTAARPPADPEAAVVEYLRERLAEGASPGSIRRWRCSFGKWFDTVRCQTGASEDDALDVRIFSREQIVEAKRAWAEEGLAASTIKATISTVVELWMWMADNAEAWPGVSRPPSRKKTLTSLPSAPVPATAVEIQAERAQLKLAREQGSGTPLRRPRGLGRRSLAAAVLFGEK